ncbi:hypothetical protein [Streptomyces sp. NPDC017993]
MFGVDGLQELGVILLHLQLPRGLLLRQVGCELFGCSTDCVGL